MSESLVDRPAPATLVDRARLARVRAAAKRLFDGDAAAAERWLETPREALGDRSPLVCAATVAGADEVEQLIVRLGHGVFS